MSAYTLDRIEVAGREVWRVARRMGFGADQPVWSGQSESNAWAFLEECERLDGAPEEWPAGSVGIFGQEVAEAGLFGQVG